MSAENKKVTPLIEIKNCVMEFPGVKALDQVNFTLMPGECHALVGENGAGKSTLSKCITGENQMTSGELRVKGELIKIPSYNVRESQKRGVAIVHQEFTLMEDMTGVENIFVGRYLKKNGHIDWKALNKRAEELMEYMQCEVNLHVAVKHLRTAEQQIIQLAKALLDDPQVIIFDELTAVLQEKDIQNIFRIISVLKEKGIGIVYISHRLEEIFEICDQVSVLRDGALVMTKNCSDTNMNELISAMVGRSLDNRFPPVDNTPGDVILRVEHLSTKYAPKLQDITFDVKKGEIFGLYGLVGAGRTELLETIFGIRTRAAGRVYYDDKLMNFHSSKDAMDHGFALITEERKADGLFLKADITFNTTIANMSQYKSGIALSKDEMVRATAEEIRIMHTKCMGPDDMIANLSGGNQQKAIFGRWLERSPKIFMMDDPTRGIDVGAKYEIYELIINMAKQGKTIIVVSSEMPEILGITNRIGVMSNGRLAGIVNTKETNQEELLRLSAKYL